MFFLLAQWLKLTDLWFEMLWNWWEYFQRASEVTLNSRQRRMEREDNDLDFPFVNVCDLPRCDSPLSQQSAGSTAVSLMCHESLKTSSYQLQLNFVPKCSLNSKTFQIDDLLLRGINPHKKQCYIMWTAASGSFAFPLNCKQKKIPLPDLSISGFRSVRCAHHWQWQF